MTSLCHVITCMKLLIWNGYHATKQTTGSKVFKNIYHPLYIFLVPNGYFWGPGPWITWQLMLTCRNTQNTRCNCRHKSTWLHKFWNSIYKVYCSLYLDETKTVKEFKLTKTPNHTAGSLILIIFFEHSNYKQTLSMQMDYLSISLVISLHLPLL